MIRVGNLALALGLLSLLSELCGGSLIWGASSFAATSTASERAQFDLLISHYPTLELAPIEPKESTNEICLGVIHRVENHEEVPGATTEERLNLLHDCINHIDDRMGPEYPVEGDSEKARLKLATEMLRLEPEDGQYYLQVYQLKEALAGYLKRSGRMPEARTQLNEAIDGLRAADKRLAGDAAYWLNSALMFMGQVNTDYPDLLATYLEFQKRGTAVAEKFTSASEMDREFVVALGLSFKLNQVLLAGHKPGSVYSSLSSEQKVAVRESDVRLVKLVHALLALPDLK